MDLLLASTSPIRRAMLENAGVAFAALSPAVDEARIKGDQGAANDRELATALASAKAEAVSKRHSAALVIGSDSLVSVGERRFSKPVDRSEAADHLRFFSGKTMVLTSAVALAHSSECVWSHVDSARLQVRPLSEAFIMHYLDLDWPEVGYCVGVFRMEGLGVQLFERVDGDHFAILGMPLVPLLGALRQRGLLLQ